MSGIDWAAIARAGGIAKGRTRRAVKLRKAREDQRKLKAFRDAVWARENLIAGGFGLGDAMVAWCQSCGRVVNRGPRFILTGEVHHRIFRGNKATRYDPNNGVLLCNHLVNNCHEKAERKLIQV